MDITSGHWIFAGLFLLGFTGVLLWSFKKDRKVNSKQFGNVGYAAIAIGLGIILLIIIKFALRQINH